MSLSKKLFVMSPKLFQKLRESMKSGIEKWKSKKGKPAANEEVTGDTITQEELTIAKIKSQKQKILRLIKRVRMCFCHYPRAKMIATVIKSLLRKNSKRETE